MLPAGPSVLDVPDGNAADADAPAAPGRSYWWVWLIVLAVVAAGGYFLYHRTHQAGNGGAAAGGAGKGGAAGRPVPVVAVPAESGDLRIYLNGIGTVTPVNTVSVHSRVDGQIVQVAYTQGQTVHHDPNFNSLTMADLDKGDQDKSDLLVEIDPRPYEVQLEQAKGQLARDQALLSNAQLDLQRFTQLYQQKSATEQQLQTQQALVAQYTATLQVDQAAIHNAQLQLTYCKIRTPIDGRVGLRLVDVGNIVHASDTQPVAVVTQVQPITVEFTLAQDYIPQVLKSAPEGKGLLVEAWNRDLKTKIADGTLEAIDNMVDPASGTILLRALYENKDNALFPRQFVNARMLVDTLHDAVIVPSAAVQRSPSSTFVYVVNGGEAQGESVANGGSGANGAKGANRANGANGAKGAKGEAAVAMRDVKVGPSEGDRTAIESGLAPGEVVVTDGVDKLVNGSKVTVRPPARPAAGGRDRGAGGPGGPRTHPTTGPSASTTGPADGAVPGAAPGRGHGRHRPG